MKIILLGLSFIGSLCWAQQTGQRLPVLMSVEAEKAVVRTANATHFYFETCDVPAPILKSTNEQVLAFLNHPTTICQPLNSAIFSNTDETVHEALAAQLNTHLNYLLQNTYSHRNDHDILRISLALGGGITFLVLGTFIGRSSFPSDRSFAFGVKILGTLLLALGGGRGYFAYFNWIQEPPATLELSLQKLNLVGVPLATQIFSGFVPTLDFVTREVYLARYSMRMR